MENETSPNMAEENPQPKSTDGADKEAHAVRRSLALAAKNSLGPFAKLKRNRGQGAGFSGGAGSRPASSYFLHEAAPPSWRSQAGFERSQKESGLVFCPLGEVELESIPRLGEGGSFSFPPSFSCRLNDVGFYLGFFRYKTEQQERYFEIRNAPNTYWRDRGARVSMNRRATEYMLNAVERLLQSDEVLNGHIAKWSFHSLMSQNTPTRDGVRARFLQLLDEMRTSLPDHGQLKVPKRISGENNIKSINNEWRGNNHVFPEKPFKDSAVEVLSMPVFPTTEYGDVRACYGAFRLQRNGLIYWVQFTNLDGSEANDFMAIHPHDEHGHRHEQHLLGAEAKAVLQMIDAELPADHPVRQAGVLDRLNDAAGKLEPGFYFSGLAKKFDSMDLSKIFQPLTTKNSLILSQFSNIRILQP